MEEKVIRTLRKLTCPARRNINLSAGWKQDGTTTNRQETENDGQKGEEGRHEEYEEKRPVKSGRRKRH